MIIEYNHFSVRSPKKAEPHSSHPLYVYHSMRRGCATITKTDKNSCENLETRNEPQKERKKEKKVYTCLLDIFKALNIGLEKAEFRTQEYSKQP
jgi:hypothetical protein